MKVAISSKLEERLKVLLAWLEEAGLADDSAPLRDLMEKIAAAKTFATARKEGAGVGYRELLSWFRDALYGSLAVPPNPSPRWIVRQIARARELGLDEQQVRSIAAGARKLYPNSNVYELEWLLRCGVRLMAMGRPTQGNQVHGNGSSTAESTRNDADAGKGTVYTGRH